MVENVSAPVKKGDVLGKVTYTVDGESIGSVSLTASDSVEKISYGGVLLRMLKKYLLF